MGAFTDPLDQNLWSQSLKSAFWQFSLVICKHSRVLKLLEWGSSDDQWWIFSHANNFFNFLPLSDQVLSLHYIRFTHMLVYKNFYVYVPESDARFKPRQGKRCDTSFPPVFRPLCIMLQKLLTHRDSKCPGNGDILIFKK